MKKDVGYLAAIIVLIILLLQRECKNRLEWREAMQTLETVKKSRNKLGEDVATSHALVQSKKRAISFLSAQNDSLAAELSELIRGARKPTAATVIHSVTTIDKPFPVTVTRFDTVYIRDSVTIWPRYSASFTDKWIDIMAVVAHDTMDFKLKVYNDVQVVHRKTRKGIMVMATQKNPYSETSDIKTWEIPNKPKRWGLGFYAGYGMTSDARLLPSAGIALHYSLIQF